MNMMRGSHARSGPPTALASLVLLLAGLLVAAPAAAQVTLNVIDGSDGETPVSNYRWLVEEDTTYHVPFDAAGNPVPENDMQALSFHSSYMPVVAEGTDDGGFLFAREADKYYYISVLPDSGYTVGGALVGPGETEVTVYVNPHPIPTAQIVIQVCEDNAPINNVCDPGEQPLEGFKLILEDAGGRYGMAAGIQSYDVWGNPLGTTYLDANGTVDQLGSGIVTGADGMAYVKNLAPGKYGVIMVPPPDTNWQQTSTIEGKKIIDAWVKANEPPFFAEFGPPGPHVSVGFVSPFNDLGPETGPDVKGQVVNLHMSRPPEFAMYAGGPFPHTNCWVGLNDFSTGAPLAGLYASACSEDGNFTIPNVPAGEYQLVVWDDNMDLVFLSKNLSVDAAGGCNGNNTCDLGPVPARQWFARMENWVFNDLNQNGRRDCDDVTGECEPGIPEQAVNLRWRDGTMYQSFATDLDGFVPFDEVFPFFSWLVAEVDFGRLKATGATIYVDDGGAINPENPNTWGSALNPQMQGNPADPGMDIHDGYGGNYGDARTEQGVVLTEAFQAFLGQTNVIEWGKTAYGPGENGGISGAVFYSVTRAEDDPRYGGPEPWEPGIPGITVNLYDSTGTVKLATTTTDSWDDTPPTNCQDGSAGPFIYNGTTIDCYDGLRNWNQVRPGIFDGGYAFEEICDGGLDADGTCTTGTLTSPIRPGRYVVEVEPGDTYQVVKSQDKNVDFGDEYAASGLLLPPECVGTPYTVPQYLTLNDRPSVAAADKVEANTWGDSFNLCDRKKVAVSGGNNAAADFFLFTQVPVSAHATGFILDDTANEFDPNSPQFGEKYAPPFVPVSIRDWTGREIGRTYSDQYGRYNFVAPSSWTNSLPQPSGMSPNMLTTCMNAKLMADGITADPQHNSQYSQFCYTFQYMPGATVYLDTPVVPVAAFTGSDQYPLDCEYGEGTPRVFSATNAANQGPYVAAAGETISITAVGNVSVPNPAYCPSSYESCVASGVDNVKNISRDYSFGCAGGTPTATIGGTPMSGLTCIAGADGKDVLTGTVNGSGGQLVITRGDNSMSSINAVNVQVGLRRRASVITVPADHLTIQAAIDAANLNDLILVAPGVYQEMVIMWKPVQLQGWGEGTKIDAVKAPPESLLTWREAVQGLVEGSYAGNPTGYRVTLVPGQEAVFGGVEPAALWTEEGAGVIVLARAGDFGDNLNQGARIDGFTITGADTGGGIILNGYASDMQISNNRVINNSGQYSGGIRLGHPYLVAEGRAACGNGEAECYPDAENDNVTIKHNYVGQNGGITGVGGGVSICTGSESYALTDNYICGNFNMDQGGGVAHYGFSDSKSNEPNVIARNVVVFNDIFKQTPGSAPSGAGLLIAGQPAVQGETLSPGTGNVLVDGNLFLGNAAEAGDGGGIRLQQVNGQDVEAKPSNSNGWHSVEIVNNMIANNVAGMAGGGISLADAKKVTIRHNTIANNDSTATSGNAFPAGVPDLSDGQLGAGIASRGHTPALLDAQRTGDALFSDATLEDNIVWHNRTFRFNGLGETPDPNVPAISWFGLCPDIGGDPANCTATNVGDWQGTSAYYSDIAVLGTAGTLSCLGCLDSDSADPLFVAEYASGQRRAVINQPEQQTIHTTAAFDEGGNFIRLRIGPLTRWDTTTGALLGDYHIQGTSPAIDSAATDEPAYDFDGETRPMGAGNKPDSDIGADEFSGGLKLQLGVTGTAVTSGIVD